MRQFLFLVFLALCGIGSEMTYHTPHYPTMIFMVAVVVYGVQLRKGWTEELRATEYIKSQNIQEVLDETPPPANPVLAFKQGFDLGKQQSPQLQIEWEKKEHKDDPDVPWIIIKAETIKGHKQEPVAWFGQDGNIHRWNDSTTAERVQ